MKLMNVVSLDMAASDFVFDSVYNYRKRLFQLFELLHEKRT